MTLFEYDKDIIAESGRSLLCGVDEAGRGPLAGPVFAAAVILKTDCEIAGLNDSKKLTEKKRDLLFDEIIEKAAAYSIASVDAKTIDEINILQATLRAMREAVAGLHIAPELVLVDGNSDPKLENIETRLVIGGDAISASIAAASILAKVSRDRYMLKQHAKYPQYSFNKHKGYGTKAHYEALDAHDACDEHRASFLKKWRASK